jgi:Fe-S cluster assembly protein SufD
VTAQTIVNIDSSSVLDLSRSKNEPEWMITLRAKALDLSQTLELPRLEKTRIDRWNVNGFGAYKKPNVISKLEQLPEAAQALVNPENVIVQHNSGSVYNHLTAELAAQGVIFTDLEAALQQHGNLIEPYFMKAVSHDENLLTALHTALWSGGVFLYVPKNVTVDIPLQALFLTDDTDASFSPHVIIVAESNSSVTYVENFVSSGSGASLVQNGVVEVYVKAGAKVSVGSIHNLGEHVTDLTYRRAVVENDGLVNFVIGELSSGNAMSDTSAILRGKGSTSDTKIISVATGDQKLNYTTRAVHWGKNSSSDMITRAVMRDSSTAIINGITKIEKGATGANGQQTEKVLMLSPKSRGDANPILLIDEDDVKAGHAASVGQVNPDQVYYLMSRGISKQAAERLIINGFLAPVISEIPIANVQAQLQQLVERKLEQ